MNITLERIFNAAKFRISNLFYWQRYKAMQGLVESDLDKIRAQVECDTAIVVCNGPSLTRTDLSLLSAYDVFTMNRAYLSFAEFPFESKYHLCINELVLEQWSSDLSSLAQHKFYNYRSRKYFALGCDINWLFLRSSRKDKVSQSLSSGICSGATVTFVALQLAIFLGYKKIVIVGLDHNFGETGTPNKTANRSGDDKNHFRSDYFPPGSKWQLPDLKRNESAYQSVLDYCQEHDIQVYDCTVGGHCTVFPKAKLEDVI